MKACWWVRLLARLVPAPRRDEWLREWEAERAHRARERRGVPGLLDGVWMAAGAAEDALGLRLRGGGDLRAGRDLRFAVRSLARTPGFTVVSVLTLALGIGATTAIFTVAEAVLLRPLPYAEPGELVRVELSFAGGGGHGGGGHGGSVIPASEPEFLEVRAEHELLVGPAGYWLAGVNLDGGGDPARVPGARVSADFLEVLGVEPVVGRDFLPGEDRPGGEAVAILSHGLWTRAFAGDPAVVGREIRVDGAPYLVVGVLPSSFVFPGAEVDLLRPMPVDPADPAGRSSHYVSMVARLAPDTDLTTAQARTDALARRWAEAYPDRHGVTPDHPLRLIPLREALVADARPMLLLLLGAVLAVLLVASANVAALMLVRGERRRRETGVRMALGGSRRDVVAPFVAESLVLAGAGGALGVTLAGSVVGLVERTGPAVVGRMGGLELNATVLLLAAASTLGATLLFGVAPARTAAGGRARELLRTGRSGGAGRSAFLRSGLVAGQVALGVVLVVASALLTRSLASLQAEDPGFESEGVVALRFALAPGSHPDLEDVAAFHDALAARLPALPGLEAAGMVRALPFADPLGVETLSPTDRPEEGDGHVNAGYQIVTPGWFEAMGVPLLEGRLPGPDEAAAATGAVVVNRSLARAFWPGEDAVGRTFKLGPPSSSNPELRVVGVVGDVRQDGYARPPGPQFYVPLRQALGIYGGMAVRGGTLVARSTAPPAVALGQLREAVRAVDPTLPVSRLTTLRGILGRSVGEERFVTGLVGSFSVLALLLAAVGVGGLVSWTVSRRSRELGLRMALGAEGGALARGVLLGSLRPVALGLLVGLAGAWWAGVHLADQLHTVGPRDPAAFGVAPAVLLAVATLAAWGPARRATRIDPVEALRRE